MAAPAALRGCCGGSQGQTDELLAGSPAGAKLNDRYVEETKMSDRHIVEAAMEAGHGVLRLAPTWVPRSFCIPGRRLKLHSDDYHSLGSARGGIDERWLSSTVVADNGPLTPEDEGLSYVVFEKGGNVAKVQFREAVQLLKDQIVGERLWKQYSGWPVYSKFFDNWGPLPLHIHHDDAHAALVGKRGKPEMYYFPAQLNNHGGTCPFTFLGLNPGTTKAQLRACLAGFEKGDNKILDLSQGYRLRPGTGWDVPPGVLHAPGSLCTYEPQYASDVFAMYQSVLLGGETVAVELLWKDTPADRVGDLDYLLEIVDWEMNVDPELHRHRFMAPVPAGQSEPLGYEEKWICYRSPIASAKECTVPAHSTVKIKDAAAYGLIALQGHGSINSMPLESPVLIRFGQLTYDEYFVTEQAASEGVTIVNPSPTEPIVILKHFGPGNPDLHTDEEGRPACG